MDTQSQEESLEHEKMLPPPVQSREESLEHEKMLPMPVQSREESLEHEQMLPTPVQSREESLEHEKMLPLPLQSLEEFLEHEEMLPPPITRFQSREELLEHVYSFARSQGYILTIRKSEKDKKVILKCDKGGVYRGIHKATTDQDKKKRRSRLTNCPFRIDGKRKNSGSWVLKIKNLEHNHKASKDISVHPSSRRFSKEEVLRIKEMTIAGIEPLQMLTSLRQRNRRLLAESRDLYNCIAKIRKEILTGRTRIQALLDELTAGGFHCTVAYDEEGHLTHLFFAHPKSIAISRIYSNVFVMDCAYKTNKYKMPLLNVVGVTSFNSCFYSCFALLLKEEKEDYVWALKMFHDMLDNVSKPTVIITDRELALMGAIQVVFPRTINLLCVWHIEKDILSKCKCHFQDGDNWDGFLSSWSTLIESPTEIGYHKAWQDFRDEFKDKVIALDYISTTWLPFKEGFIKAWTEKYLHFGYRSTSRVEGLFSKLKIYLQLLTGDFYLVKSKLCHAIENQFEEIKTKLSVEKVKVPSDLRNSFLDRLVNHVSVFALRELFKQYKLARSDPNLPTCMNHFSATMGLPCAHKMRYLLAEGRVLYLGDIHSQWRIDVRTLSDIGVVRSNQEKK
ncbi:protein FAR1-RELATED SEQUENCE 5-like [Tasmannia lanceolata]|uniref:protein FAR1-RELATED SEQUENCE 5-like n=1 Tax=Tasmannia lanceolata TaxID=3420 RepID=UPI0040631116